jgi:hypothetical protein
MMTAATVIVWRKSAVVIVGPESAETSHRR